MTGDHEAEPRGPRGSRIQWPWQAEGWHTEQVKAEEAATRDPALEAKIAALAHGWIRATYRQSRSGRGPINNPWLNIVLSLVIIAMSTPVIAGWTKVPLEVAIPVFGVLALLAAVLLVASVIRIPVWHRARRIAHEHIAQTGGGFPLQLRWYQ